MFRISSSVIGVVLSSVLVVARSAPMEIKYEGMCEASAAAALDAENFVVADDEYNVLSLYRIGVPKRLGVVDISAYLDTATAGGTPKKSDIEGAARIDDRIYWIASHSRDKKGNLEPSRFRFFATDVSVVSGSLTVTTLANRPYRDLLADLTADSRYAVVAKAAALPNGPEQPDGLNIEGLAATADKGLLIGFRNPRPGGLALLAPLLNPSDVVAGISRARFGDPILLNLGTRGIRSIDRVGTKYVIVAGPYDNGRGGGQGSDFALYIWSGVVSDLPRVWTNAPLGKLGPEAFFQIPGKQQIHVLSDDGDLCKALNLTGPKMRFRGVTLSLPPASFR
jgi:hypothetical protein